MTNLLLVLYIAVVGALSIYGILGFVTLALYWRHRRQHEVTWETMPRDFPEVTVQLPIYNERLVVERLIAAAASLLYPRDRLQIQVIDDSDDETSEIAAALVARYREEGLSIAHIQRKGRDGFKAGALANALEQAAGEYIAIFDADFQPHADFLMRTVPHFLGDDQLGMIQARWGHLNDRESVLTAAQAIALDKHFVMEQFVRHRANMFPKFNGSAGIWRRKCVEQAGGWQSDTVCEDLCLSTRAVLQGWSFRYLDDVVAPAELPASIRAYKNQQARWAKGSVQCLRKYGLQILADSKHSLAGRLYALLSMSAYATHLLLILLLLLQIPLLFLNVQLPSIMVIFTLIGIGQPLLFVTAQHVTYRDWARRLLYFPVLLIVAIGLAPSNARAILQALFNRGEHPFIRTPKGSPRGNGPGPEMRPYRLHNDGSFWLELLFVAYSALGLGLALAQRQSGPLMLLLASLAGFLYVAALEWHDLRGT